MASGAVKKLAIALGAALLVFIALVVALPVVASTQLVRDRIALELSMWSGYRVEMGNAPELQLWPSFRARLSDVSFHDWADDGSVPVIAADTIEAGMSALAALRGDVVFTQLALTRPTVHVWPGSLTADGDPNPAGRLRRSIAAARALVKNEPAAPDMSQLPRDPVGTIEFNEGRVTVHEAGGDSEILTGLSGRMAWPALDRPMTFAASGIWRGELVRLEGGSDRPLLLVAGGTAPLRLTVNAPLINAAFDGTASLAAGGYAEGSLRMASPSLRRLLEWSQREVVRGATLGPITIEGQLSGSPERMRVAGARVTLDGRPATGTLEFAPGPGIPSIAGTLAFERFDIQAFLAAFSALTPDASGRWQALDDTISDRIGIDVRLSASTATVGSATLADLAATVQLRPGIATFDISDASAFGGRVQAGMRVDRNAGGTGVEVRVRGEDIDMGELARAVETHYLLPVSRGTFSVALKGQGNDLYNMASTSSGVISASFGPGAMAGIDLAEFRRLAASGQFFPLSQVSAGTLAFSGLEFKATVDNGTAQIVKAQIATGDGGITLHGVVPLPGAGLALAGSLTPEDGASPVSFFVGGSWRSPYVSPIAPPIQ